jgi:hypothetical protein
MDNVEMCRRVVVLLGEVEEAATILSLAAGARLEELTETHLAGLLTAAGAVLQRLRALQDALPAEGGPSPAPGNAGAS